MKALEERYGVRLFDRRGRRTVLTDLGEALLAVTRRLHSAEEEAEQILAAARGLRSGTLRVGADAPYSIVPSLGAFSRQHPGIKLQLSIGNSNRVLTDLLEHRCDVALLAVAGSRVWTTAVELMAVGVALVVREPRPQTVCR